MKNNSSQFMKIFFVLWLFVIIIYLSTNSNIPINNLKEYYTKPNNSIDQYSTDQSLGAPMIFINQLYPRNPYLPSEGKNCNQGCGALGICKNEVCALKEYKNTVFNIPI